MLKFIQNNLRNGVVQEILGKDESRSVKMHFSFFRSRDIRRGPMTS